MIELDSREVYKVGLLSDIAFYWKARKNFKRLNRLAIGEFLTRFKQSYRRKSYWNGYLAEPYEWPWLLATCGHGWTKRRAVARLNKYCALAGVNERYVYEETDD